MLGFGLKKRSPPKKKKAMKGSALMPAGYWCQNNFNLNIL
jgi:hypothetical protein